MALGRARPTRRGSRCVLLATLVTSCGKSAPPPRSLVEDKARRDVPIAICRKPLAPTDVNESGAPRAEAYWSALLPSFHGLDTTFDAVDCLGQMVNASARPPPATPTTIHVSLADSTISPVPDGTQLVWLRTSTLSDRLASGLLALVRPRPSELEVYAIGFYTGSTAHSRFELAKLGAVPLLTLRNEGCADVKVEVECESTLSFALVLGGQLVMAGTTPAERLKYGVLKDVGRVKSRLTIEPPIFEAQAVRIKEKISVHDVADNEVRKLEGERIFTLRGSELVPNTESIWTQVERR
jgi:hypothetical protein